MKINFKITFLSIFMIVFFSLFAFAQQPDPLRAELEHVYQQFQKAQRTRDHKLFKSVSASSHYMKMRNATVSYKNQFPEYLFDQKLPDYLSNFNFISLKQKGPTASLIYYETVNIGGSTKPTNKNYFMSLKFIQEHNYWKYSHTQFIQGDSSDLEALIMEQGVSYLESVGFLPNGIIPPTPKPCSKPDFMAQIRITSVGYDTYVDVNGYEYEKKHGKYASGTHLLFGGLKIGTNIIRISTLPLDKVDEKKLAVSIIATKTDFASYEEIYKYEPTEVETEYSYNLNLTKDMVIK